MNKARQSLQYHSIIVIDRVWTIEDSTDCYIRDLPQGPTNRMHPQVNAL